MLTRNNHQRLGPCGELKQGLKLSGDYENTVIDAGGRDTTGLRSALLLSQKAIIPVGASNLDAAAMTDLLEVVDLSRDYNPNLDVRVLLTRIDVRTKEFDEMVEFIKSQGLNLLQSRICERVAYRRAMGEGAVVTEINKDASAVKETLEFIKEVSA